MVRALRVALIFYGVIMILGGLLGIITKDLVIEMLSFGDVASHVNWLGSMIGKLFIAIGVFVIIAGLDPLRHINWVGFIIMISILGVVVHVHSILVGYVEFSQIGWLVILDGFFAIVFLALYPWRAIRNGSRHTQTPNESESLNKIAS